MELMLIPIDTTLLGLNFILRMVIIFAMLKFYVKIEKKTTPYQLL